ncbi:MAG: carboxylating nicotinate-nucleotide diphosphorylase [Candidatus Thermoplasmatota archaeon]|nr:carboxylating nicotinate-nucleotide diphosphorylase [Candidatus Thermoplasmatota archaeon]
MNDIIDIALSEDLRSGDITTDSLIPSGILGKGKLLVKEEGVLAGIEVASDVFHRVEPSLEFHELIHDGSKVKPGDIIATISGPVSGILKAERTALNFLQHMSGIATITARYVEEASGFKARILDTRKTIPGMRSLEKYAVRAGGGKNHRQSLGDMVLIKDNHLAVLNSKGISLGEAVEMVKRLARVEVEAKSLEQVNEALEAGADIIMLDNMSIDDMRLAVELCRGKVKLEASGGITLENVRAVAETGVDFISAGSLTHSARALDISLELEV